MLDGYEALPDASKGLVDRIVVTPELNHLRHLNKFLEDLNQRLTDGGLLLGCFIPSEARKRKIFDQYPEWYAWPYYTTLFLTGRVMPKLRTTQRMYFNVTKGKDRQIPLAEMLGRLVCCGFEIVDYVDQNGIVYFTARKVKEPSFDMNPSYGPLFTMKRVGKGGEIIRVYKLRTMHPYAEYLQDYMYQVNSLEASGKFKNDFRITTWGQQFRKVWIDELPMLINWAKRDLKLVGVRPLSQHYLSLYPKELADKRIQHKPGLVPPYYADLPKNFEEILASEERYLTEYERSPWLTDLRYFLLALYNIFIRKARSK